MRKTSKKTPTLVFLLLKSILPSTKQGLRVIRKTFPRLYVTTVIKNAIMLGLVPSIRKTILPKTSNSPGDLYVSDWG